MALSTIQSQSHAVKVQTPKLQNSTLGKKAVFDLTQCKITLRNGGYALKRLLESILSIALSIFFCCTKKARPIDIKSKHPRKDSHVTFALPPLKVNSLKTPLTPHNTPRDLSTPQAPPNTPRPAPHTPKTPPNTPFPLATLHGAFTINIELASERSPDPKTKLEDEKGDLALPSVPSFMHTRAVSVANLIQEEELQMPDLTEVPKERPQPPHSNGDTATFSPTGEILRSRRNKKVFMTDDFVLPISSPCRKKVYKKGEHEFEVFLTRDGKSLVQQRFFRGGKNAALAMLILDCGKIPDFSKLKMKMSNESGFMESSGVQDLTAQVPGGKAGLQELSDLINEDGPACIEIDLGWGPPHSIVVDKIDLEAGTANVRDPFHCWAPIIKLSALETKFKGGKVIQAKVLEQES